MGSGTTGGTGLDFGGVLVTGVGLGTTGVLLAKSTAGAACHINSVKKCIQHVLALGQTTARLPAAWPPCLVGYPQLA